MVRALASHQCGPGSIPGLGVICGLSLLLVLVPAPRVFLQVLRFSSLHKNQHFQLIPFRPGNSGEKSHSVDSTEIPIYLFILFFIYKAEQKEAREKVKLLTFRQHAFFVREKTLAPTRGWDAIPSMK